MAAFPPTGDLDLDNWQANFDTRITATPTAFGLVAGDATAFHALATDYHTKLLAATNPSTRTKSAIAAKDIAKKALLSKARQLIKIITADPAVTPVQRDDLGLRPLDTIPTAVPAPTTKPLITITPNGTARSADETTPTRRARPARTIGCFYFTKIDSPAPVTPRDCTFDALSTRATHQVYIPPGSNGKTLWVLAQWVTETGQVGPVSTVASTTIAV